MKDSSEKLCVVMPVYNEQDAIGPVLEKWAKALDALGIDYAIRPYNDGSKDNSLAVMKSSAANLPQVDVRDKKNGGHGNTILTGYRDAAADGFDWVFQIDSDDEMGPEKFGELWAKRDSYDFLVGIRDGRVQQLPRKIISFVSRLCVRLFYGRSVWDVNTPYRLMRVSAFKDFYQAIPLATFAPNVILSGLAARHKLRCYEIRVPQHDRMTGEVSIKKWKLLKAAARSFAQTIEYAWVSATLGQKCLYALAAVLFVMGAVSAVCGFLHGWREYDFQWDPAKLLMMGDNPYLYSLEHKPILHEGFCEKFIDANQVPSCLLLLAPFTFLPQLEANYLWDVCNLLFTIVFLWGVLKLWGKEIGGYGGWLVCFVLLSGMPWRVLIGNGQHLMFSLAFFVLALWAEEKGRSWLAGLLLALAMFKYTTTAPLALVFLARGKWKPIAICGVVHLVLSAVAGLMLGENPVLLVRQALKVGSALTGQGDADVGSLARACGLGGLVTSVALVGYAVYAILCLTVVFAKRDDWLLKLAVLAVISNVACYHRNYDFVTLIFPFLVVLRDWQSKKGADVALRMIVIVCILWTFYGLKVAHAFAWPVNYLVIEFSLQHMLLFAMLVALMRAKADPKNSFISTKSV